MAILSIAGVSAISLSHAAFEFSEEFNKTRTMEEITQKTRKHRMRRLIIILAILVVGGIALFFLIPSSLDKYIAKNCPTYTFNSGFIDTTKFIDCRGIIGIEKYSSEEYLTVFNELYFRRLRAKQPRQLGSGSDWDDFGIQDYRIINDALYYIEDSKLNDGKPLYHSVTEWPEDVDFLSRYRKLNTNTATFTLYKTQEEIPENERKIFKDLES